MGLRQRKKEHTRELLIAAAIHLFSVQGIEATTIDQIAAEADTGKGTFYNYFKAKEDTIVAFMAGLEAKSLPAVQRFAELDAPLEAILDQFAWRLMQQKRDYRVFVRVFFSRMIAPGESFLPYAIEMQKAIDITLNHLFTRLQQRGLMTAAIPMNDLRMTFKTMHLGLSMLWALEPAPSKETRKITKIQMAMFAAGVKP